MAKVSSPKPRTIIWLLVGGFFVAFLAPALLTRKWGAHLWPWFHFNSETGVIGDTFGGITGPILNFVGLILVYLSFQQQLDANKVQRKDLKKEICHRFDQDRFDTIRLAIAAFESDLLFHKKSFI